MGRTYKPRRGITGLVIKISRALFKIQIDRRTANTPPLFSDTNVVLFQYASNRNFEGAILFKTVQINKAFGG